jgi:hypothetical protein
MRDRANAKNRREEFIQAVCDNGCSVSVDRKNPSIIHIKGKNETIRCNLKCTRSLRVFEGMWCYWYGIRTSVLEDIGYLIFAPVDGKGFYIVPKEKLLNNLDVLYHNPDNPNYYTFYLNFTEELIFGYIKKRNIPLDGTFGLITSDEKIYYEMDKPELPFFPNLR